MLVYRSNLQRMSKSLALKKQSIRNIVFPTISYEFILELKNSKMTCRVVWCFIETFVSLCKLMLPFKRRGPVTGAIIKAIQCPFLLYITDAYRTNPTAALQVVTGLQPLHLQIQKEGTYARVARARSSFNFFTVIISSTYYESKSSGIHIHSHNFLLHNQISIAENQTREPRLYYTDGSKTDEGTGRAYCILENYGIIASWQGKLDHSNLVLQAEILAIKMAIN
ncbi:hypothetical protein AVEN_147130-1 [Araneus ventricosus]|uniref:RNase H type-1 domain-containing protein n=1 Tax=Araneus ventricosus TaxID=182803 RepID=A0A4Y2GFG2_ARAVE|nr:hypothetical protein AVEN_147130-1 [Araneus ventricosus]